jgi:hypothetical protein
MAESWYIGANIPGKPRVFTRTSAASGRTQAWCDEVAAALRLGAIPQRLGTHPMFHPA